MKNIWDYHFIILLMVSSECYSRHIHPTSKSAIYEPLFRNPMKPLLQGQDRVSVTDNYKSNAGTTGVLSTIPNWTNSRKHVLTDSLPTIIPDFELHPILDDTKHVHSNSASNIKTSMTSDTKNSPVDTGIMVFPDSEEYSIPSAVVGTNELSSELETRNLRSPTYSSPGSSTTFSEFKEQFIPIFREVNEHSSKDSILISKFFDMEKFKILFTKSKMYFEDNLLEFPHSEEPSTLFNSSVETITEVNGKYVQNNNNSSSNFTSSDVTTEHYLLIFPGHVDYVPLDLSIKPYIPPSKVGDKDYLASRMKNASQTPIDNSQTGNIDFRTNFTSSEGVVTQNTTTKKPIIDEDDKFHTDFPQFKCPEHLKCRDGNECVECD